MVLEHAVETGLVIRHHDFSGRFVVVSFLEDDSSVAATLVKGCEGHCSAVIPRGLSWPFLRRVSFVSRE